MPLYPRDMQSHGPCRSLPEIRVNLIARRLDLLRQQLDAKNAVAGLGQEIAAVEARLRAIDAAGGK